MKIIYAFIVSITLATSGCGFAERHPTQAKVYGFVGAAMVSGAVVAGTVYGSPAPSSSRPGTGLRRGDGQ